MRRALAVVVIVAVVALTLLWSLQRRLIYFPSPGPLPPAHTLLADGQDVDFDADDGIRLAAWYFPVPDADHAVLVLPGNAGDRSMRVPIAAALNRMGRSVLLVDYRGYGGNPGSPTEEGLAADARAAAAWLAARPGITRISYFGESLGAAVAVGLATERPPHALILRSPFTSLPDVGAAHYPWLPVRWLLRDRYPSIDRIGALRAPLLVIVGDRDHIVPEAMSRRLYEAANAPKRYVVVPGADHNDLDLLVGPRVTDAIRGFLSTTE
ncbi:alpha/beta superfamily hydrolase [Mycolicibacterium phlei]|jgi:fermentation-respiration switch protein FrsA (DUF1100 family)|uniref:Serine aminopeptidase S33 domain-containing protein n=1 Tax=Mycolicibacterium phlei DSM 43239 = CCUG 21000 TaxID=1226750 RepID=A0A5N5VHE2_MYCPH|nr:alpha/beta hydrolase [Mycolicibacterium phlei]VEG11332.1 alpha/beta superfamily hydrolase [Mycobacteroides chelonae]AMO63235.1 Alpha/beta hydrolase family protein [Mycolicibacterium phlei]EID16142.1 alpha/beta superfamily hydrolase [Mycolicibacterium phlei RIVM601174]KAB7759899.1 hypothetical protein MPHL21000_02410 [Mycolicibacterium phlei DSM 43239 = CCUG 21000]KXW64266.1 hypothetical protein MPHL43072_06770 [Mycolicibacterium phlei DSM 43072]